MNPARVPSRAPVSWSWVRAGLLGALFLCSVAALPAADEDRVIYPGKSGRGDAPASPSGPSLNSMSLFLGLTLAGAGGWMFWRNRRMSPLGREARALAIDETRSLGNRQFLVVASYEGKKFLLGVCPGRIEYLSSLDGSSQASPQNSRQ